MHRRYIHKDKYTNKMKTTERINIRGTIRSLEEIGSKFIFPRNEDYKPSTIRNTAVSVKADTGRWFKVEVAADRITVIRIK